MDEWIPCSPAEFTANELICNTNRQKLLMLPSILNKLIRLLRFSAVLQCSLQLNETQQSAILKGQGGKADIELK